MKSAFVTLAAIILFGLSFSEAAWSQPKQDDGYEQVTARSRFGSGISTAPVRQGLFGAEIRLPNGTWISCKLDCKNTLREETVDFWEEKRRQDRSR